MRMALQMTESDEQNISIRNSSTHMAQVRGKSAAINFFSPQSDQRFNSTMTANFINY